jgi:hypothetical protein
MSSAETMVKSRRVFRSTGFWMWAVFAAALLASACLDTNGPRIVPPQPDSSGGDSNKVGMLIAPAGPLDLLV